MLILILKVTRKICLIFLFLSMKKVLLDLVQITCSNQLKPQISLTIFVLKVSLYIFSNQKI